MGIAGGRGEGARRGVCCARPGSAALNDVILPKKLNRWRRRVLDGEARARLTEANTLALDAPATGKAMYVYSRPEGRWLPAREGFAAVCVANRDAPEPDFPPPTTVEDAARRRAEGCYTHAATVTVQRGEHAASLAYGLPLDTDGALDVARLREHVRAFEAKLSRDHDTPFSDGAQAVSHEAFLSRPDGAGWRGCRAPRPRKLYHPRDRPSRGSWAARSPPWMLRRLTGGRLSQSGANAP